MQDFNEQLEVLINTAFIEDIGDGDHSTRCCIPASARGKAILMIKQEGIIAGMEVARKIFLMKDTSTDFQPMIKDGGGMKYGQPAFEVESSVHTILNVERLVLNTMQRMSGIATLTQKYVDKLSGYHTKVLDTRKTTPNFRLLEKEAVRIGGGYNHRMGLYDMIMLKDNHIEYAGGIEKAIDKAWQYITDVKPELKIEVETRNLEEVKRAAATGKVHRIMLDNFNTTLIREALKIIDGRYETEASGGINIENICEYAETGVDFVSVGALIHQAVSLDLSLKAVAD